MTGQIFTLGKEIALSCRKLAKYNISKIEKGHRQLSGQKPQALCILWFLVMLMVIFIEFCTYGPALLRDRNRATKHTRNYKYKSMNLCTGAK